MSALYELFLEASAGGRGGFFVFFGRESVVMVDRVRCPKSGTLKSVIFEIIPLRT